MHPVSKLNELQGELRGAGDDESERRRLAREIRRMQAGIGTMVEKDAAIPRASAASSSSSADDSPFTETPTLSSFWAMPDRQISLRDRTRKRPEEEPPSAEPQSRAITATRAQDDQYLKDHGNGLFPNGIADLRPERLFMGARVYASSDPKAISYNIDIYLFDKRYAHQLHIGFMQVRYDGPTAGLHLGLFYGHCSGALPDETMLWERIWRRSAINPRKYMTSVLRAFVLTRLVQFEHLSVLAPITLTAIGSLLSRNDQEALVWYYRSMGFVDKTPDVAKAKDAKLSMITSVGIFMDYTSHMSPWTANFDLHDQQESKETIFPIRLIGSGHRHIV